MVVGFITTMQSMSITTNIVSLNPAQARCSRHYVISLTVTCSRLVVLSGYFNFRHDIAEILLKVALNTITLPLY
jgi:hypothetical protein